MFASTTLQEHLLRGLVGIGAFAAAVVYGPEAPWLGIVLVPAGLIALRGCPMCWMMGLFETLGNRVRRDPLRPERECADGRCSVRREPVAPRRAHDGA